jgi:AraC family transcriptional regulator
VDANTVAAVMSRRFRLDSAPTLAAPTMSKTPIAFTRLRCMDEQHGRAGPVPCENSFAFQVMLQPIRSWDLTTNRGLSPLPPTKPGDAFLFDLSENPRVNVDLRRVGGLRAPASGAHDPVLHGMAISLTASMVRPSEAETLFVESMALAFHAHVISAYGGIVEGRRRLGLAPWQLRRVCDAMEAELDADHSISRLARECGLSSSHFARAFKTTTGLAPHQWLTRRRIARARELLAQTRMELADIACACGFVDQSHFSRIFARVEKQSPGRWRRRLVS